MLHDTIYSKGSEVFGPRKKKPPVWFKVSMDTIGPTSDHKRYARLSYLDNLAKLKDTQAAAQHTTRKAQKTRDDICLLEQNCKEHGDIAGMHTALKYAMGPMPCVTALLRDINGNVLCKKPDQLNY